MVHRLGVTPFVSVTSMTSQPQLVTWHGLSLVQFRLSSLQIRIPNPATTKRRQTTADPNFILKISSTSSFSLHGLYMLGILKQSYIENLKGKRKEGEGKGGGSGKPPETSGEKTTTSEKEWKEEEERCGHSSFTKGEKVKKKKSEVSRGKNASPHLKRLIFPLSAKFRPRSCSEAYPRRRKILSLTPSREEKIISCLCPNDDWVID